MLADVLLLAGVRMMRPSPHPPTPVEQYGSSTMLGDTGITYQGSVETGVSARAR